MKKVIVTGGAGFIGSALVRRLVRSGEYEVLNIDKLTYAGNLNSLNELNGNGFDTFLRGDICDGAVMAAAFNDFRPNAIFHLAAESHVDRSIDGPELFLQTNVMGTCTLLKEALRYLRALPGDEARRFRFVHVSTDEVFGDAKGSLRFHERSPYQPNSPYAASKASSDHLVRAWGRTFGLPAILTNCSNNYGHFQFPEKLIPLVIIKCLRGEKIPVYGNGLQVRDWLYVDDHVDALMRIMKRGNPGESYNIGGDAEVTNLEMVHRICDVLDSIRGRDGVSYRDQIQFVADRPGHDVRYAIDFGKLERTLAWRPRERLESGLAKTVRWYLDNEWWWGPILARQYSGERLGLLSERNVTIN